MSRTVRQALTTFVVVIVTLVLMHMLLHADRGGFAISRNELVHQAIVALVLTVVLTVTRGRRG